MLACLPLPGDLPLQLVSRLQMNAGLQKWDTVRKMRSAQYPTPAELDAYAKKIANSPLTIKIFPNSIKVPQKKQVRRTVNGLDISSQRYSPYPTQASAKMGLLAIVKMPSKVVLREAGGSQSCVLSKAAVNSHCRTNITHRTLNLSQTHNLQAMSLAPSHTITQLKKQGLPCLQTAQQQPDSQDLRHHPILSQPLNLQAPQAPTLVQSYPQLSSMCAQPLGIQLQHLQEPLIGRLGTIKMPDGEVPPNVTVSTSTIPLSMTSELHYTRPADLRSIVHQINHFCQTRVGVSASSLSKGQIANPSAINRNLLIGSSPRMLTQRAAGTPSLSYMLGPAENIDVHLPTNMTATFQSEPPQNKPCSWSQPCLAHLPQIRENAHQHEPPPKDAQSFIHPRVCYLPDVRQSEPLVLKHQMEKQIYSSSNVAYTNAHFAPPIWSAIVPNASLEGSGSKDVTISFPQGTSAAPVDCNSVVCYLPVGSLTSTKPVTSMNYLGSDLQTSCFQDRRLGIMEGMPPPVGPNHKPNGCINPHLQHLGYR